MTYIENLFGSTKKINREQVIEALKTCPSLRGPAKYSIFDVDVSKNEVNIISNNPGLLIGLKGRMIKRIAYHLRQELDIDLKINILENDLWK